MSCIEHIDLEPQHASFSPDLRDRVIDALEGGKILFLPRYRFVVTDEENAILFSYDHQQLQECEL